MTFPIDEEDEFGGAKGNPYLIWGNGYKPPTTAIDTDNPAPIQSDEDEDEFGGVKGNPHLIWGKGYKPPATAIDTANPAPIQSDEDENEFGGVKGNPHLIWGKGYKGSQLQSTTIGALAVEPEPEPVEDSEEVVEALVLCDYPIFSPMTRPNQWHFDLEELTPAIVDPSENLSIHLVCDTEFYDSREGKAVQQRRRKGLTTQLCGLHPDAPRLIFAHNDQANVGRIMDGAKAFPLIQTIFHPMDYLQALGLEVEIRPARESELVKLPKCVIVLIGHFLTAELNLIAKETVKERIKSLQKSEDSEQIASGRRAYCQKTVDGYKLDYVSLEHIITIDGLDYNLCLKLVDTGAIHGAASFKDFCDAVGWKLQYKDNFTKEEKGRMEAMAVEKWRDFENYARGDLDVGDALWKYAEVWKEVYDKLGATEYFRVPKLTIGGTVKDLFEGMLALAHDITSTEDKDWSERLLEEIIEPFIKPASANDLRQFTTNTRALLAKVEGGRCRNNRPTAIYALRKTSNGFDTTLICDIDISGCYGEGQRNQNYFIGIPEIFDYKASRHNSYITLRNWLKAYDVNIDALVKALESRNLKEWQNPDNWGELISGAWHLRFSTTEKLKYPQDYFASWFTESADRVDLLAKFIRGMKSDTEMVTTDWVDFDEETGNLKIFNHEIWNGCLTHDGLQWILAIASPRQRNELLDKCQVLASSVYPRSQQIKPANPKEGLEILKETHQNWKGKNTTERVKVNGRTKIVQNFEECHAWYAINLGDLLVDRLLIERKRAQIVHGKKSPLDVLFKLCVNTLYGDMVSKFFITSNPTVGNNITARARALAWYMEKGFHGWQSITDGCAFELNGVLYPSIDNINGECINLHRKDSKLNRRKIKRLPLGNEKIVGYWTPYTAWNNDDNKQYTSQAFGMKIGNVDYTPIIKPDEDHEGCQKVIALPAIEWIDKNAMNHLQTVFPVVDVLHLETTAIKIDKESLEISYKPRNGQFTFESKDVYHSGAFHGSANYLLTNPNGDVIKMRGYEIKKEHDSIEADIDEGDRVVFLKTDRYGAKNSPAKDFMKQLVQTPSAIKRQAPAAKKGILKISDYKNLADKYDKLGLEPGDSIIKLVLMQEFSLSQFTFQTYEQYMQWKSVTDHLKDVEKQSFEGFFLNNDGTLNFEKMVNWIDEQIAAGCEKPFDLLADPNRNDRRSESRAEKAAKTDKPKRGGGRERKRKVVSLSHPQLKTFLALREQFNDGDLPEETQD